MGFMDASLYDVSLGMVHLRNALYPSMQEHGSVKFYCVKVPCN